MKLQTQGCQRFIQWEGTSVKCGGTEGSRCKSRMSIDKDCPQAAEARNCMSTPTRSKTAEIQPVSLPVTPVT